MTPPTLARYPAQLTENGAYRCPAQTHRNGIPQQCRSSTQRGKQFCTSHQRCADGLPGRSPGRPKRSPVVVVIRDDLAL
jgi:hypothetical protein